MPKPPAHNLDDAIQQLRWLIENDFSERRLCALWDGDAFKAMNWWESAMGRADIRRLRSYIAGVRVLEAARREPQ